jgi:hypothetical protein
MIAALDTSPEAPLEISPCVQEEIEKPQQLPIVSIQDGSDQRFNEILASQLATVAISAPGPRHLFFSLRMDARCHACSM